MDYDESLDKAAKVQQSLKKNIEGMRHLTQRRKEFQRVRRFYSTAPEWSSKEGQLFREMMELIKNACDSFGGLVEEARVYVLRVKAFTKDTTAFTTEAQEELSPSEEDELLRDWKKSIDRMKESNDKIDQVKKDFKAVLDKLRTAQTKASDGLVREREKADAAAKSADTTSNVAMWTVPVAYLGGVAAAPGVTIAAGVVFLCSKFGEAMFAADAEKHEKWKESYHFVAGQLDEAFAVISTITEDCKTTLNELSQSGNDILDKLENPTSQKRLPRTDYFKRKCIRLREDSEDLQQTCIEYIRKDDELRRLTE